MSAVSRDRRRLRAAAAALAGAVLLGAALAAAYVVRTPPVMQLAHVLGGDPVRGRLSSWYLSRCPAMDGDAFRPNSVIGAVLAGTTDANRATAERLIEALLACGVSLEQEDDLGLRPLHTAVLYGDVAALSFLLSLGADESAVIGPGRESVRGLTALEFAERVTRKAGGGARHAAVLAFLTARAKAGGR